MPYSDLLFKIKPTLSILRNGSGGDKNILKCGGSQCKDIECNKMIKKFSINDGFDVLTCSIKYVIKGAIYNFTLRAENPYINTTIHASRILDYRTGKGSKDSLY